ncbi:MAG: hypothetical protein ACRDKZ_11565 [Actinomycetota bacterium]
MRTFGLLSVMVLTLAACGVPERSAPAGPEQKYRATGVVLDEKQGEPVLCLGVVLDSLPPQCDGLPIAGWDWDAVSDEESVSGTTWGRFEVTGLYVGETFTLLEAGPPPDPTAGEDAIRSACSEPPDGWERPDSDLVSEADRRRAIEAARDSQDFAGAWIDYIGRPTEFTDPADTILSLAFTGGLAGHEQEIRRYWGGPLCVTAHEHTLKGLRRIQEELSAEVGQELGLEVIYSDISENRNVVELGVVVIDTATQNEVNERYGEGTVEITAQLQPVP